MLDHCGQGLDGCPAVGRSRHDLELMDALAPLAVDGAEAIGAGVAAADDDDVLVVGRDELGVVDRVAGDPAILAGQEIHGEMDARRARGPRSAGRAAGSRRRRGRSASNSSSSSAGRARRRRYWRSA